MARARAFSCYALTVTYGQLHRCELAAAQRVAAALHVVEHRVVDVDLASLATSALTSPHVAIPKHRTVEEIGRRGDVPNTYVPARNTVMLALGLAWAETLAAFDLFVGFNVLDSSGYPDCRPEFVAAFEALANVGTRAGDTGVGRFRIHAPLIEMRKAEIIRVGVNLGLDYGMTHSCYDPPAAELACGACDACLLRARGFREAGIADPTRYNPTA
jgi:7-cyano-7-deazaguanine synthase